MLSWVFLIPSGPVYLVSCCWFLLVVVPLFFYCCVCFFPPCSFLFFLDSFFFLLVVFLSSFFSIFRYLLFFLGFFFCMIFYMFPRTTLSYLGPYNKPPVFPCVPSDGYHEIFPHGPFIFVTYIFPPFLCWKYLFTQRSVSSSVEAPPLLLALYNAPFSQRRALFRKSTFPVVSSLWSE